MKNKSKKFKLIRKIIYLCLFATIIGAFVYLSNKYESLSETKTINFTDYYAGIHTDKYNIIKANGLLKELKSNSIYFINP